MGWPAITQRDHKAANENDEKNKMNTKMEIIYSCLRFSNDSLRYYVTR